MNQSMARPHRNAQPTLESLEERQLLANIGDPNLDLSQIPGRMINRKLGITVQDQRITYRTPQGANVLITLYGVGSLAGSTVDPDGALNLVFSETRGDTGIVAKVTGGNRRAPLRSMHHRDLNIEDLSGVGSSLLNVVNLKGFDLVDNGRINLTGGVHALYLNSVGRNTQINLREEPVEFITNQGSSSTTSNGVNLSFLINATGASTLTGVTGEFVPGFTFLADGVGGGAATNGVDPGPPPAPPGVVAVIRHINGSPRNRAASIQNPQIFGLDPTDNALIRFDAKTGAVLQRIALTGLGTPIAGVALGRNQGRLVAMVGDGTNIRAFDAVTGDAVGQFTTTNLGSLGFDRIDGVGSTDTRTVVTDSSAGDTGLAVILNITESLATGHAVTVGQPFAPTREFQFSGGVTGVPASHTISATGAAHFDTFQPNLTQFGILSLDTTAGRLSETARTALKRNGAFINTGPAGAAGSDPIQALGSIDQSLALVTDVADGKNIVSLFSASSLSAQGRITLDDPNRLAGLSESFRPDLVDSALIDVQGNLQSIRGNDARGLVLNAAGFINLAMFRRASDSVMVGQPFGHAEIAKRSNVTILSTRRPLVDGRNGVDIIPGLKQIGPLSLPG
jgi:hypothetical protein